jgi:hypothetical protein
MTKTRNEYRPQSARSRIIEIYEGLRAEAGPSNEHKVAVADVATVYLAQNDIDYWDLAGPEQSAICMAIEGVLSSNWRDPPRPRRTRIC